MKRSAAAESPPITCALTVHQPWAWCVANGHKDVENRSWQTAHRGWLAIHAGATVSDAADESLCAQLLWTTGVASPPKEHLVR